MYRYKCLNPISEIGLSRFTDAHQMTEDINEADGVLVRSASMHDMELPEGLLAVARAGAGVNNIPLDKCAEHGTVVFNTPGANANGVKELVIAGMLLASRDVTGGIDWVKENAGSETVGKDAEKEKKRFAGTEIMGKRLGIIGLGAIGIRVANAAVALGMDVYGYDPYLSVDAALKLTREVRHVVNVDDIYSACDMITVHVPLMDATKGMIDAAAIAKMKQGVIILNFARDLLVNDDDMLEALGSGKVRKYVSDFPTPKIAGHKDCIVIPHLGASTEESEDNCAVMAVDELKDYLENGNIRNSVNYPMCDMGVCGNVGRVAILHKNIANMITQFTAAFGDAGINISDMTNKSKGEYAYTLMDIEKAADDQIIERLRSIKGVFRVRVVR